MIVLLALACAPAGPVLHPEHPADCAREPAPELTTLCLVQVAADRGRAGDAAEADQACDAVTEPTWSFECHFRAGEELAAAGQLAAGLHMCQEAGRFRTFCFTHAAWRVPPTEAPVAEWETLGADFADTGGVETLRSRWWFNHYFGTGTADAAAAREAPETERAAARGAWALEAVRLVDGDMARARAAWDGEPLTGVVLPAERRIGRYDLPFVIPGEAELPHVPGFGGSSRLVGETDTEDLEIALLEAAYFRETAGSATFLASLHDPRPRVRYTALRAYRTLPSPDAEAVLSAMAEDPDPIVRKHVADALQYKTWLGKANAPGLRVGRIRR